MISSKEVANAAKVSVSTVSRCFSCPNLVNKKTLDKVLRIAKELHYIPDMTAKSLRLQKSNIIGMVISDINNPFYLHEANELSSLEENKDYRFYITFSQENGEAEYKSILSLIASNVDTIIFTPASDSIMEEEQTMIANNIHAIQIYRKKYDLLDSLVIDDAYGTYLATKELIKNGHTNIILFDYNLTLPTHRDEGYIKAFNEAGIKPDLSNIIKFDMNPTKGYDEEIEYIISSKHPTAIIPVGDDFINATFKYLNNHKLKVKDDISVVSYDDNNLTRILNITAVTHPFKEITETLTKIINKHKNNQNTIINAVLKPFLISRDSISKIN